MPVVSDYRSMLTIQDLPKTIATFQIPQNIIAVPVLKQQHGQ